MPSESANEGIPICLPALPNELWLRIFELATEVFGILDPDVHDPFEASTPLFEINYDGDDPEVRHSLDMKSRLVRVCRRWHMLATPLLYQIIIIRHFRHINTLRLIDTIKQAGSNAAFGALPGRVVHRLDIAIREPITTYMALNVRRVLSKIVKALPSLRILVVIQQELQDQNGSSGDLLPPSLDFAQAIDSLSSLTVQKLRWDTDPPLGTKTCRSLLTRLPSLRTLMVGEPGFCPFDLPSLPDLHFATLLHDSRTDSSGTAASFPNLRQALFRPSVRYGIGCITEFLASKAPELTTVYLEMNSSWTRELCRALARHCPHVSHIILFTGCSQWSTWNSGFMDTSGLFFQSSPYFPPITHLGLFGPPFNDDSHCLRIFRWLRSVLIPSSLKVVRFLNPQCVMDMLYRRSAAAAEGLIALPGLRVEDHEGNDLRVRIIGRVQ